MNARTAIFAAATLYVWAALGIAVSWAIALQGPPRFRSGGGR